MYTVKSKSEAWNKANELFKGDYIYDAVQSKKSGYPVYWSTIEGSLAHINDLNARLEVVDADYNCVNIWIEEEEEKEGDNTMIEHIITVGLFDKDSKRQEITTISAYKVITNLFCAAGLCCTILDAQGVYKHDDGSIVIEPSLRVECAGATVEQIKPVIFQIKAALNQESVMYKRIEHSNIDFI